MKAEDLKSLNEVEISQLQMDLEREVKRREAGPKYSTYYVISCVMDALHFESMDCALRCLKHVAEDFHQWVSDDEDNRSYVNRCTGVVGVKFQVVEMTEADYLARKAEKYFDDDMYPEKPNA